MSMRRAALMLVLVSCAAIAQTPQPRLFKQPNLPRASLAFFEAFPASGAGVPSACSCTQPSVVGTGLASPVAVTTTRTNNQGGYCTNSDYSLTLCPSNTARVMTGGGSNYLPLGILTEFIAGQNDALQVRDASNVAWVKTTMTCTKTATGADNEANAASTCTANASNALVAQTVLVTGQRAASLYIKRRTGTGTVSVAPDGATFTDITSRLSTTVFKRIVASETIGCMYGGCIVVRGMQASFGVSVIPTIRVATSGDAVDLDFLQVEAGYETTSPIASVGVAGTRGAETNRATVPAYQPLSLSLWTTVSARSPASSYSVQGGSWLASSVTESGVNQLSSYSSSLGGTSTCFWVNGGVLEVTGGVNPPMMGPIAQACTNNNTTATTTVGGVVASAVTGGIAAATGQTTLSFGSRTGGAGANITSRFCADTLATRCATAAVVTPSAVAWVGDSITAGSVSSPTLPPSELTQILGRPAWNHGVPSDNSSQCATRFTNNVLGKGYAVLVWSCGTNDMIAGSVPAAHAAFTAGQNAMLAALASGMRVIATNIMPEKKDAGWNASIQAALEAYNSDMAAWCATAPVGLTCLDAYAAFGGGTGGVCVGADPACLLNAYDSGDGRHPNGVGSLAFATLVSTGSP